MARTTASRRRTTTRTRGGTSAQHAKAGHLGGIAPHRCRGRQCSMGRGRATTTTRRRTSLYEY